MCRCFYNEAKAIKIRQNQIIVQYMVQRIAYDISFAYSFYFYTIHSIQIFSTHIFFPTCNSTRYIFFQHVFFSFPISDSSLNVCLIFIVESIFYKGKKFSVMHRKSTRVLRSALRFKKKEEENRDD